MQHTNQPAGPGTSGSMPRLSPLESVALELYNLKSHPLSELRNVDEPLRRKRAEGFLDALESARNIVSRHQTHEQEPGQALCTVCNASGDARALGQPCTRCGEGFMVAPGHTARPRRDRVFRQIASAIDARHSLRARIDAIQEHARKHGHARPSGPDLANEQSAHEWIGRHADRIRALVDAYLPHGSGFDNGTEIDMDRSTGERLVFHTSFHHMDEHGSYDGWTDHTVTVRPAFVGRFELRVSGRDRNGIKEYIAEAFQHALDESQPIE